MQHFDIASVRATVIPADSSMLPLELTVGNFCRALTRADDHPFEMLPIEDFSVSVGFLPILSAKQRRGMFKASSKARDISRRNARAAKRASSYIA